MQISEEVRVTAEAPLLDTNSVSSGANFDTRMVDALPMFANMPIMLARFSPGVNPNDAQTQVSQGYVDNTTLAAGTALGTVGSNNYSIDGANNNGTSRRLAGSPNSDMVQEMRVESSNFDAAVGHGTGLQISMMTRAGTNTTRGTANYQYWTNRLNSLTVQQKLTFDDRAKELFNKGRSHNLSLTHGGPVRIPHVVDGRGKLFYFANYSYANDAIPGKLQGSITVPANAQQLQGDFSDLLTLPNSAQYQIYDPLTTHPDPNNPNRMVRDPFPSNIIPHDRIFNADGSYKNPMMNLYSRMVPEPNQNFIEDGQQPSGNFYQGGQPDSPVSTQGALRLDYNASQKDRFFFRGTAITFLEYVSDWAYLAPDPALRIQSADRYRPQWSFTGDWTHTVGKTVFDTQFSSNRFTQVDEFLGTAQVQADRRRRGVVCQRLLCEHRPVHAPVDRHLRLPGLRQRRVGPRYGDPHPDPAQHHDDREPPHAADGASIVRHAQRYRSGGGNRSGQFTFDRTYTRQASDESQLTASNLGLSLAAFELGIPTSASISQDSPADYNNYFSGAYGQDTWRLGRLTINLGPALSSTRTGLPDAERRVITGFDPTAKLAITDAAQAAYLASGVQNTASMLPAISVLGGPVYATTPGYAASWPKRRASGCRGSRLPTS